MNRIRLLPVVVLAISALLVLKTLGLVTNGGYVLVGATPVQAAGGGSSGSHGAAGAVVTEPDATLTFPSEPVLEDTAPTVADTAPTLGASSAPAAGGHGEDTAESHTTGGETAAPNPEAAAAAPVPGAQPNLALGVSETFCRDVDVTLTESGLPMEPAGAEHGAEGESGEGEEAVAALLTTDCLPSGDAVPLQVTSAGTVEPLMAGEGTSLTEQQILQRLAARRAELEKYEQDLTLRSSLVDAAEKRIQDRATTLEALEAQIASLVDQREQMETGQFAAIVAMYEVMKPKDAAKIFNNLDMEVLVRVSKAMQPRKMAPILAEMDPARAQELTVRMAALADLPVTQMAPDDLAALPQIVGQ